MGPSIISRIRSIRNISDRGKALLILLFLSPLIGELLSGSAPPVEFFNPFVLICLTALYGCGDVLVRETTIKWNKGWGTVLLLGAAYGIVEEGLAVKSWFDPNWMDLGTLAWYGRFAGVNTIWAVWLTLYHAVISIAVPIMLIDLAFPHLKGKRITSDKAYRNLVIIEVAVCVFIFAALTVYFPPVGHLLLTCGLVAFLIYLAKRVPNPMMRPFDGPPDWGPARFWLLGTFFMVFNFIGYAGGGNLIAIPLYLVVVNSGVGVVVLLMLVGHIGTRDNERHMVAFISGLLTFMMALGFIHEIFTPGAIGMSLVSLGAMGALAYLYKTVSPREAEGKDIPRVPMSLGS